MNADGYIQVKHFSIELGTVGARGRALLCLHFLPPPPPPPFARCQQPRRLFYHFCNYDCVAYFVIHV